MKNKSRIIILLIFAIILLSPTTSYAGYGIAPAKIFVYSYDKKVFLGTLSLLPTDKNSVFNPYGKYGSKYNPLSIWNEYGKYGGDYSSYSAWNPYASMPPVLIYKGEFIGYISTNPYVKQPVLPTNLYSYATTLY